MPSFITFRLPRPYTREDNDRRLLIKRIADFVCPSYDNFVPYPLPGDEKRTVIDCTNNWRIEFTEDYEVVTLSSRYWVQPEMDALKVVLEKIFN